MASLWDHKAVVLRESGIFLIPAGFLQRGLGLLVIDVGKSFEKQNRRYIAFVFVLVDGAPQDIARLKQVRKQFLAGGLLGN